MNGDRRDDDEDAAGGDTGETDSSWDALDFDALPVATSGPSAESLRRRSRRRSSESTPSEGESGGSESTLPRTVSDSPRTTSRRSSGHRGGGKATSRSRRRRARVIRVSVLAVGLIVLAVAGWVGVRAWLAKSELEAAVPLAHEVQRQIVSGAADQAASDARDLVDHARAAKDLTGDPIWRAVELVPFLGPNLTAVRQAAEVTDIVASRAVYPLAVSVDQIGLSSFQPVGGAIDIAPLVQAQPAVAGARAALDDASQQVDAIDASSVVGPVADAVSTLRDSVDQAHQVIIGVDNAARLLPAMLGADGPRNYLLMFQNPAELRAGGGITSALALIHTENGAVTLTQQASATEFPKYTSPVIALPDETRGLFQDKAALFVQNTTLVPQFDLSGQIASTMWADRFGEKVDGVLAFDPVGLSYLLNATGPIELAATGDKLTADNAVAFLLSDVYSRYTDPKVQDAVFAEVAKAVFDRVAAGDINQSKLLDAMIRSGDEQRIRIWSAHPEDQTVLAATTLAGGLPATTQQGTGIGVYFNDATGAKMDYYLTSEVEVVSQMCRPDGRPVFRVQVTITNTAPADAATSLPAYVTGGGAYGVPPGSVSTYAYIFGPGSSGDLANASIALSVDAGADGASSRTALDGGHTVAEFPIQLAPGESRTVTAEFLGQVGDPVRVIPSITPTINTSVYEAEILESSNTCELG